MSAHCYGVEVVFHSDWGVGTGTGVVGGVDAVVETDSRGRPVVRATALTGVVREQAAVAAHALDGGPQGPWRDLATALFGGEGHPRLVSFSDAVAVDTADATPDGQWVKEAVSVSLDDTTQTAKDDHLRFLERAAATTLRGTVTLLEATGAGTVTWTPEQRRGTEILLAVACGLVEAIGSGRSTGDGTCTVRLTLPDGHESSRSQDWPWSLLSQPCAALTPPSVSHGEAPRLDAGAGHAPVRSFSSRMTLHLGSPVVSYDSPTSNEVRSLDFLRGTVLLAWVHRRLRQALPDSELVRDAVVAGHLAVSDARLVGPHGRGLPVPLALSRPKAAGEGAWEVTNRLLAPEPEEVAVPLRAGQVYDLGGGWWGLGATPMTSRQSTAYDTRRHTAAEGQLFLVRAIAAGVTLRAEVSFSEALVAQVGGARLAELLSAPAMLGSRRLAGTFGRVRCETEEPTPGSPSTAVWDPEGALTLWFTSDLLLRSASLGPAGGTEAVLRALRTRGADVVLVESTGDRFNAGLRYRRVDGYAADGTPRPSRVALTAGSVLRVRPADGVDPDAALEALRALERDGLGELVAQGFGRVAVGHRLLTQTRFPMGKLLRATFMACDEEVSR